jgi:hypothetical protein
MPAVKSAAAWMYACAGAGAIAFQLALALGAPWGRYAMGGRFPRRFPLAMRAAALVQAVLLAATALVVLTRAGLVLPTWTQASVPATWVVVGVSAVSVVLNFITPSDAERRVWFPVAAVLLGCSLVVALVRD